MKLIEIHDRKIWDDFIAAKPWASFQQSWAWGEFQKSQGHQVRRFFFGDALACQLIHYKRRLSGYWFAPRGPVFVADRFPLAKGEHKGVRSAEVFSSFLTELLNQKLPGSTLFYRFEPALSVTAAEIIPPSLRLTHAMSPASTLLTDLTPSEDELLAAMHPKTRYNIKVADKHGVTVREDNGPKDIELFLRLIKETGERDAFTPLSLPYLRATFEKLKKDGMARLHIAEADGQALAASLVIVYGDTMTYLHGASSSKQREAMAPYALHWAAMCEAKREGLKFYDWWGCNPQDKASYYYKPSWEGITRFKEGWGGERVNLAGTWDLPKNKILYRLAFLKNA